MFFVIFLIWVIVFLLIYYFTRRHLIILGSKLPGPKGYPILGNALMFYGNPERTFQRLYNISKEYERFAAIWIGPQLHVAIFNAKDAEAILKAKGTVKSDEYRFFKPWLGESILISEGAKFKQNKKLLTPAFHSQNLKQYLEVFSGQGKELINILEEHVDKEEFDIHPYLSLSTMFVLLETSMGVKRETLGLEAADYAHAVERLGRFVHMRVYKVWLRPDMFFKHSRLKKEQDKYLKVVHPLTERVIRERKKEYIAMKENQNENGETHKGWPIFLDKFLEAKDEQGSGLTDEEIKDEVMTMLFAGQDTTSVSMGFCLCLLGLFQDVQEKLFKEIYKIFGDSDRNVTYEDCKDLQYMEQVIQETWRLYPPIPLIGKRPTEDIQIDGYTLPKDCTIGLIIMLIHRDPQQFPNPTRFNPDNFLPEKIKARSFGSYIPFSAGQRTCIGQRYAMLLIKVFLSYILRRYQVFSTTPEFKYKLAGQTSLKRKDGFTISLKRRKKI